MKMDFLNSLAQLTQNQLESGMPDLKGEYSTGVTWMIIAVAVAGILVIAFKTSGRSHLD